MAAIDKADIARRTMPTQPDRDPLDVINSKVAGEVPQPEQKDVRDLIVEELKRVHIGAPAGYGIRPSQFERWIAVHRALECR